MVLDLEPLLCSEVESVTSEQYIYTMIETDSDAMSEYRDYNHDIVTTLARTEHAKLSHTLKQVKHNVIDIDILWTMKIHCAPKIISTWCLCAHGILQDKKDAQTELEQKVRKYCINAMQYSIRDDAKYFVGKCAHTMHAWSKQVKSLQAKHSHGENHFIPTLVIIFRSLVESLLREVIDVFSDKIARDDGRDERRTEIIHKWHKMYTQMLEEWNSTFKPMPWEHRTSSLLHSTKPPLSISCAYAHSIVYSKTWGLPLWVQLPA